MSNSADEFRDMLAKLETAEVRKKCAELKKKTHALLRDSGAFQLHPPSAGHGKLADPSSNASHVAAVCLKLPSTAATWLHDSHCALRLSAFRWQSP